MSIESQTDTVDMLKRTANFQKIIDQAGLTDVSDALFGPVRDQIDRVLFHPASDVEMKVRSSSLEMTPRAAGRLYRSVQGGSGTGSVCRFTITPFIRAPSCPAWLCPQQ